MIDRHLTHFGAALVLASLLAGCSRPLATASNPSRITGEEYDRVFDASVDVLRDMRFEVDRRDRRFGVITTEPLIASSVFEPWYADNTTSEQVARSTLNLERRTVRIEIQPASESPVEGGATPAGDDYRIRVVTAVERRYRAPREITSAAFGELRTHSHDRRYDRPMTTERGLQEAYWRPIGDDEHLSARLVQAVLTRALGGAETPAHDTPETPEAPETSESPDAPAGDTPADPAAEGAG